MLKEKVEKALNEQIELEQFSSQLYLAMASWAEKNGYNGTANFLYEHSDEEREHMLKLFHYVNDRGSHAIVPQSEKPESEYKSVQKVFEEIYEHEKMISEKINQLVGICYEEKDFTTVNFLQWYVAEQIEEENLFGTILDKLNLLGGDKAKMYMFDNEMEKLTTAPPSDTSL
ncbi:MAG: ferritin [Bacteroidales bacterium]|nr:ferritin [Bacteroidales bacterium]